MGTPQTAALVKKVLEGSDHLPGLPRLVHEVRATIAHPDVTVPKVATLIRNDPGLTALLFKYAASPIYRTRIPATTLESVISQLGFHAVSNIVLLHSVRGAFFAKSAHLRTLYTLAWKRVITKAGLACFLGRRFSLSADDLLVRGLLSDVGSLALLAAFKGAEHPPDPEIFLHLCREYSKPVSVIVLTKWCIERAVIEAVARTGNWHKAKPGAIDEIDVMNLALYHSLLWTETNPQLPQLPNLALYAKLPDELKPIGTDQGLSFLTDHHAQIDAIIQSLNTE